VPDWWPHQRLIVLADDAGHPREDPANHIAPATGTGTWTQYEVTARIPADANLIRFGVFLNGRGQVELRNPQLEPH
jgi:hypothetical protein